MFEYGNVTTSAYPSLSIPTLSRVLKIARRTYYATLKRQPSKKSVENDRLKEKILEIYTKSRQRYDCTKIKHALERESIYVSQNRVLRLMRESNISSVICRKYRKHSHSDDNTNRPNLLKR